MLKKWITLACMAVAALALPSTAAGSWTEGTTAIGGESVFNLEGNFSFNMETGGINCTTAIVTLKVSPGTTANITAFQVNNITEKCHTSVGLALCDVHAVTPTNLPWTAHASATVVTLTSVDIDYTLSGALCPYHKLTLQGNVTATPNNPHAATTLTLSGSIGIYNGTTGSLIQNLPVGGSFAVTPMGNLGIT